MNRDYSEYVYFLFIIMSLDLQESFGKAPVVSLVGLAPDPQTDILAATIRQVATKTIDANRDSVM